jgi:hypothetical protein
MAFGLAGGAHQLMKAVAKEMAGCGSILRFDLLSGRSLRQRPLDHTVLTVMAMGVLRNKVRRLMLLVNPSLKVMELRLVPCDGLVAFMADSSPVRVGCILLCDSSVTSIDRVALEAVEQLSCYSFNGRFEFLRQGVDKLIQP